MTKRRVSAAFAFAVLLAGCQTTSGPPGGTRAELVQAGFTQESGRQFNRNLAPDDIVTTALYMCEEDRCGGISLVALGRFVRGGDMREEIVRINAAEPARRVEITKAAFGNSLPAGFVIEAVTPFTLADGRIGAEIDGRLAENRETLHIRMGIAFRGTSGRTVIAMSPNRDIAQRFGARSMIE